MVRQNQVTAKPAYHVPSMAEIRAVPSNGYTAASSFSGAGGSSAGYRMAGFEVAWASEFVAAAADTYKANAGPGTFVDTRDIRQVTAAEILGRLGMQAGELDIWDGSPPCGSFSIAGTRERGWGKIKAYSDTAQRSDDLFFEYARLVAGVQPRVFVAENVAGLVTGTAKGYFKRILASLRGCGYQVQARLLDASWLGVPQARKRLVFIGVRSDLGISPAFPRPLPYRYTIADALGGSVTGLAVAAGTIGADQPAPTILTHGRPGTRSEITVVQAGELISRDPETGADISMTRYAVGREWRKLRPGTKSLKYLNLTRPSPDAPLPTVTQRGGDPSTASVTHWDQCRKLTLGELRRLSGFPDDFVLTGTYAQRWERIGRAVPPVMMAHVAAVIRDQVLAVADGKSP